MIYQIVKVVIGILVFVILVQPYLGIVFIAAGLLVYRLIPPIPIFTSAMSLLGAVTLVGFLLRRGKERNKPLFDLGNVRILGLLFIAWMFISNPLAAWFGDDRNWIFTYVQLWMLVWLTGELLDTPQKQHTFMWVYSAFAVFSAVVAIRQGEIGVNIDLSRRDRGYVEDPNIAAQYFIVAMLFLNYLRTAVRGNLPRFLAIGGMITLFIGVFFTISRTGILLIFITAGLMILMNRNVRYRIQLTVMFIVGLFMLWFMAENIVGIIKDIGPAIMQGTDTAGLRYELWKAGLRMWLDHPVQGVGIGMYPLELVNYRQGVLIYSYVGTALVAHNMYIQLLAETGLVGFGIFVLLIVRSLKNFRHMKDTDDPALVSLRNAWYIAFLVMMLGGVTLSSQYDKLIWITFGVSTYFNSRIAVKTPRDALNEIGGSIQNHRYKQLGTNEPKI